MFAASEAERVEGAHRYDPDVSNVNAYSPNQATAARHVLGDMDNIAVVRDTEYLTTTIFVKYNYSEPGTDVSPNRLVSVSCLCLPNGLLQHRDNPNANDTIWLVGRNAPSRGEAFRVRINLAALKNKPNWRVQAIAADPVQPLVWDD